MSMDEHKALARRLYEDVFGQGRLEAADEIMAEGIVSHGPGSPASVGTAQIKHQALLLRGAFPDLETICRGQIAESDRVATQWTGRGTFMGPLALPTGEVPPTGAAIEFDEIRIDRFEGGRIVESWFIPDRMSLWQKLGLIPRP